MNRRTDYLLQVLEKLGTPLMAAISETQFRDQMMGGNAIQPPQAEAEKMARLLSRSADLGVHLSSLIDLNDTQDEGDSVRLALTALAAPLVANVYRLSGQIPNEVVVDKIKDTLQAAILFSDQFSAGADASARLQGIDRDFFPADDHQIFIQTLMALVPAVNAVAAFAFGQAEKTLVQTVCDRLVIKAKGFCRNLAPELSGMDAARAELVFLRAAVQIYAQCHFAEMAKMMSAQDAERSPPSLDPVWQAFELRMEMLSIVAKLVSGDEEMEGAVGSSGGKAPVQPKVEKPVEQQAQATSGNPMSFFSKGGM